MKLRMKEIETLAIRVGANQNNSTGKLGLLVSCSSSSL